MQINWARARLAAEAADLAYTEGKALAAGARRAGLAVRDTLDDAGTGANACLLSGEGLAFLAVRGTEKDFRDILTDLDVRKRQLTHDDFTFRGRIHAGFQRQALAIMASPLGAAAARLQDEGCPVIACGHSLGGAVALLASIRLGLDEVYSFGAPRVGDKTFAAETAGRRQHFRFTRAADIVPHLPLLGLGYRHDAPALYFDGGGRFLGNACLCRQWASLIWRSATRAWIQGPITGIPIPAAPFRDHRVSGYVDDVERETLYQGVVA